VTCRILKGTVQIIIEYDGFEYHFKKGRRHPNWQPHTLYLGRDSMQISKQTLKQAVDKGLITPQQADGLWDFLGERNRADASLKPTSILYYLGGCIAIGAMTIFMNLGWETFGGMGLSAIAFAYAIVSLILAEYFQKKSLTIPVGIMAALTVSMVPLFVYGIQTILGYFETGTNYRAFHGLVDARWVIIELSTVIAGLLVLLRYRIGFILMPICVALFYLSMDLTPFLFTPDQSTMSSYPSVAVWFGLCMLVVALVTDLYDRSSKDFAFWLYLFGVFTLWLGISVQESHLLFTKLLYLGFNLLLIGIGTCLMRKVFLVFGGLGVLIVLGDLSSTIFKDSIGFPFSLTVLGLLTIGIGIWWQRNERKIQKRVARVLPHALVELRERRSAYSILTD